MYPLGHIVSEISSTVILGSALLLLAAPRARAQPRPVAATLPASIGRVPIEAGFLFRGLRHNDIPEGGLC